MKRRTLTMTVFLFLLALGSALAQDVRYNFDRQADFSKFKTYKWVPLKDAAPLDELVEKQIVQALDQQLEQKGLKKVDSDDADLYIGYQVSVKEETEFTTYSTWGSGPGWYGGWYGPRSSVTTAETSVVKIGTLVLDVFDSAHHDLIWRGEVSKTIDSKAKPDKQTKNLNKAVAKLLKNYPPPQKKS
jgi:Domain of unknown function (DUF4136)